MIMYLHGSIFFFQILHATVIKQMQRAETLEAVKESDLRVSVTYHMQLSLQYPHPVQIESDNAGAC